jgi:uncharacterized protein (DUF427 family)
MKIPGPDHPITIEPYPGTVRVRSGPAEIARSDRALALREASYPAVFYIPRDDVRLDVFKRSETVTHCPYKGDAAHYSLAMDGRDVENAAWSYEGPYEAVSATTWRSTPARWKSSWNRSEPA